MLGVEGLPTPTDGRAMALLAETIGVGETSVKNSLADADAYRRRAYRRLCIARAPRTMVATHSEGMPLHLSAASTSGYQYVVAKPSGKFQASVKGQFLGSFDTALEAAVCVATHLSLPKEPPSAARGAKRALLTAKALG